MKKAKQKPMTEKQNEIDRLRRRVNKLEMVLNSVLIQLIKHIPHSVKCPTKPCKACDFLDSVNEECKKLGFNGGTDEC